MLHNRKTQKVRGPIRDNSRNLSVRMTEEQYRRLQQYMELTRLKSTAYFCRLIQEDDFKGRGKLPAISTQRSWTPKLWQNWIF